ncbi:hypothetical protein ACFLSQ_06745 [Bacteroidota bacterium]
MKRKSGDMIKIIITVLFLFAFFITELNACEIDFSVIKGNKEIYSKGDELIVKVTVLLTHRNCPEGIKSTKFETEGLEVKGATKWASKNSTTFERKFKVKVTAHKNEDVFISATRTCDKEGGFGSLKLLAK